jgi:hypothetical protein
VPLPKQPVRSSERPAVIAAHFNLELELRLQLGCYGCCRSFSGDPFSREVWVYTAPVDTFFTVTLRREQRLPWDLQPYP